MTRLSRIESNPSGDPLDEQPLYARTKRELAARDWKFVQQYADAKTAVVTEIMARAVAHDGGAPAS